MASFWEQLFGPSREKIWRQLCDEINANYVEGGFWGGARVEAKEGNWVITLDQFTRQAGNTPIHYTRIRAPYVNRDGFQFRIYRKGAFTEIGKQWFGVQDVEIGDPFFDENFVVQGNSETKLRELLANPRIRELFQEQPSIQLRVADDEGWFGKHFPEGVDEIYFEVTGTLKDIPRLRALFDLFSELLHQLCEIGSAYDYDPNAPFTVPTEDILLRPSSAPADDPNTLLRPAQAQTPVVEPDTLLRPSHSPDE